MGIQLTPPSTTCSASQRTSVAVLSGHKSQNRRFIATSGEVAFSRKTLPGQFLPTLQDGPVDNSQSALGPPTGQVESTEYALQVLTRRGRGHGVRPVGSCVVDLSACSNGVLRFNGASRKSYLNNHRTVMKRPTIGMDYAVRSAREKFARKRVLS